MAKKTVASLHEGSKEGRAYTKVIKMVKSRKLSLRFDEQMVANEKVQDFFKNNQNSIKRYKHKIPSLANSEGFFYCFFFFTFPILYLYLCSIMYYTNNCRYGIFFFFQRKRRKL